MIKKDRENQIGGGLMIGIRNDIQIRNLNLRSWE